MKLINKSLIAVAVSTAMAGAVNASPWYEQDGWEAYKSDVRAGTAINIGSSAHLTSDAVYQVHNHADMFAMGFTNSEIFGLSPSLEQQFLAAFHDYFTTNSNCVTSTLSTGSKPYIVKTENSSNGLNCYYGSWQVGGAYIPRWNEIYRHYLQGQSSIITEAAAQVSAQSQRATSVQQAVVISTMLSSISNRTAGNGPRRVAIGGERGMAAGDAKSKLNAWVNISDSNVGLTSVFKGDVQNYIGGIDYALNDETVMGVSIGQDISKINMFGTRLKNDATTVAPYISYQFNDTYSADAALGYSSGDSKYSLGTTGKQSIRRAFGAINANGNWWFNEWQLSGKLSYIESQEKLKSFVDGNGSNIAGSDSKLKQLRLGAQISYWANGIMPYAGVTLVRDLNNPNKKFGGTTSSYDKEAINLAVGVNFLQGKEFSGGVAYTSERSRSQSKNDVLMASMNYRF